MYRILCLVTLALLLTSTVSSQDKKQPVKKDEPRVFYALPLVAKPGEKQKLVLRGKNLVGVKEVRVSGVDGGQARVLGAKAVPVPNNYPSERVGDSEVEIELELPQAAKPGDVKLTAVGPDGTSKDYLLLVRDKLPTVSEKEDNGGFATAQPVSFPGAVEGTIGAERDVDVFRFEGKKGDQVGIEVQAARFGSPFDGFLAIYDQDRKLLEVVDDVAGSPDPVLTLVLPRDGIYYLSLLDVHDLGGPNFGYRLIVQKIE